MNGVLGAVKSPYVDVRRGGGALRAIGDSSTDSSQIDMTKFLGCPASGGMQSQTNPLPPGRYWIDLIGDPNITDFMSALEQAAAAGVVVIENQERWDPSFLDKLVGAGDSQNWVLWTVTTNGTFSMDATRYGMPTIAPDCVQSKEQTVQAPPDPKTGVAAVPMWLWGIVGIGGFLLIAHGLQEVSSSVKTLKETV